MTVHKQSLDWWHFKSIIYFVISVLSPWGKVPYSLTWEKHPYQLGSCQFIQLHLLPHTLVCPFALASHKLDYLEFHSVPPYCPTSSSLYLVCFFLALQLSTCISPLPKSLQYWHKTWTDGPPVCSSSALFYTCCGLYDSAWKWPVCLFFHVILLLRTIIYGLYQPHLVIPVLVIVPRHMVVE